MLDLCYEEDVTAETDMNVVMTGDGAFVEVQGTAEARAVRPGAARRAARPRDDRLPDADRPRSRRPSTHDRPAGAGDAQRAQGRRARRHPRARPGWTSSWCRCPDDAPDVVEDGLTFAENALKKARSAAAATGLPAVADDSGLCVDALNGMPGVFSARWAGTGRDDAANLQLVLDQVADVPDEHRGAALRVRGGAGAAVGGGAGRRGPGHRRADPDAARRPAASATTRPSCRWGTS